MKHAAASERLLELAFGELTPRARREVEAHVRECDLCSGELARIRETRALMALLPPEAPPERGEAIVLAAAREAAASRGRRTLLPPWLWAGAAGAMAAMVVAVVSWQLMRSTPPGPMLAERDALVGRSAPAPAPAPAAAPAGAPPFEKESAAEGAAARTIRAKPELAASKREPGPTPAARPPAPAAPQRDRAIDGLGASGAGSGAGSSVGAMGLPASVGSSGGGWRPVEREAAPAGAKAARASAPASGSAEDGGAREAPAPEAFAPPPAPPPAPAPAPAQRGRAEMPAERKASQPMELRDEPQAARAEVRPSGSAAVERRKATSADAGAFIRDEATPGWTEARSFPSCPGEIRRQVTTDAAGRVVRYARFLADSRRIEQAYGPDGRLTSAALIDGKVAQPLPLDTPWLVRDARDAGIGAPPRCTPP